VERAQEAERFWRPPASNEQRPRRPRLRLGWLGQHPTLIITAVAASLVAIRLIRAARGDLETATELLRVGTTTILLGSALEFGPLILLVACAFPVGVALMGGGWIMHWRIVLPLALVVVLIAPLIYTMVVVAYMLIALYLTDLGRSLWRRFWVWRNGEVPGPSVKRRRVTDAVLTLSLGIIVLFFLMVPDTVWLPAERFLLRDDTYAVGYVTDDDGESVRLIRDDDRTVLTFEADQVVRRVVCDRFTIDYWYLSSPLALLGEPTEHPDCYESDAA
jgi:hypothetical protein